MIHETNESPRASRYLDQLEGARVTARVWAGDATVWDPDPSEIANRLGWLRAPAIFRSQLEELRLFADIVRDEGCDAVALLGMGGSSLAPETLAAIGRHGDAPRLVVLDTTHPSAVRRALHGLNPTRTLYIVSTKSGTTTETLTLFRTLFRQAAAALGDRVGERFAAITDPGSPLVGVAREHRFRRVFLNDPTFGGRYAALSLVGLVPAALLGVDLDQLLDDAEAMAARCGASTPVDRNPAARLAAFFAAHIAEGRDKATFVIPPHLASFGDWVEQLIAESTGKRGTGLLPVVGEPLGPPTAYGSDRVFVRLGSSVQAPGPAVAVEFPGPNALGGQFFLWEMTTALLGHMLGVNPFDQPDVESAKDAARKILAAYRSGGEHSTMEAIPLSETSLGAFSSQAAAGNYIAVLAYLDPRPEVTHALSTLRRTLRDRTRCATTLGYGPRYLHSTGQLHKGDAGRGLFLQLVDAPETDVEIPGDIEPSIGFRALVHAQAAGDARALADRGRRVSVLRADDIGTLSGCLI